MLIIVSKTNEGGQGGVEAGGASAAPQRRSRRERYLMAAAPAAMLPAGYGVVDSQALFSLLESDPAIALRRVIRSSGPSTSGGYQLPDVAVVEMDADRAAMLAATAAVYIEPDLPLQYTPPTLTAGFTYVDPGVVQPGEEDTVAFSIQGTDGTPLEQAEVYLIGGTFPVRGVTGPDGQVTLTLPAGSVPTIRGICVKPRFDYWGAWLGDPDLSQESPTVITCQKLADTFPGFPDKELDNWPRHAMRFSALPPTFRGHGAKIAIVDSGAATDHPDLRGRISGISGIVGTRRFVEGEELGWQADTVGYGSHSAGIITGRDSGTGIVGVVPEAEVHACNVFPGGRISDLIDVLDYCITQNIDVVNLSLGTPQHSGLVSHKIEQARQAGVACIAAAGNSAGPVSFPASLPSVLAVAAIGKTGEFPSESYHNTQIYGPPTYGGYFSAKFTCYGPQVDVCAPGVAIVSCVPPRNYAAYDATSVASSYVTALAALLVAHHPDFRDRFVVRTAARVDRLFQVIRNSSQPLALGDPGRTGAGMPDAVQAFALAPALPTTTLAPWLHPAAAGPWPPAATWYPLTGTATDPLAPLRAVLGTAGPLAATQPARPEAPGY
jgi:subtilisin